MSNHFGTAVSALTLALGIALAPASSLADDGADAGPLVLKSQGSFYIGGTAVSVDANNTFTKDQMYVQYMVTTGDQGIPMILLHGASHTAKTFETTPDGRMGWEEYFARKGHPTYVVDAVTRARSGFDPTIIADVKAGRFPASSLPNVFLFSRERAWTTFRIGATYPTPFPGSQFPVEAIDQYFDQIVPGLEALTGPVDTKNPTVVDLSALADKVGGAVLLTHSLGGSYGWTAAILNSTNVKAVVGVEPTSCDIAPGDLLTLAKTPLIAIFGDHTADNDGHWAVWAQNCGKLQQRIASAGGHMDVVLLPDIGVRGNSHMMMLEKNNLQIADYILNWMNQNIH